MLHSLLPYIRDTMHVPIVAVPTCPPSSVEPFYGGPSPMAEPPIPSPLGLPCLDATQYNTLACYGLLCPSDLVDLALPFDAASWPGEFPHLVSPQDPLSAAAIVATALDALTAPLRQAPRHHPLSCVAGLCQTIRTEPGLPVAGVRASVPFPLAMGRPTSLHSVLAANPIMGNTLVPLTHKWGQPDRVFGQVLCFRGLADLLPSLPQEGVDASHAQQMESYVRA
eukprot:gene8860-8029_t